VGGVCRNHAVAPHKQWFTFHIQYLHRVPHVPSWYSSCTYQLLLVSMLDCMDAQGVLTWV